MCAGLAALLCACGDDDTGSATADAGKGGSTATVDASKDSSAGNQAGKDSGTPGTGGANNTNEAGTGTGGAIPSEGGTGGAIVSEAGTGGATASDAGTGGATVNNDSGAGGATVHEGGVGGSNAGGSNVGGSNAGGSNAGGSNVHAGGSNVGGTHDAGSGGNTLDAGTGGGSVDAQVDVQVEASGPPPSPGLCNMLDVAYGDWVDGGDCADKTTSECPFRNSNWGATIGDVFLDLLIHDCHLSEIWSTLPQPPATDRADFGDYVYLFSLPAMGCQLEGVDPFYSLVPSQDSAPHTYTSKDIAALNDMYMQAVQTGLAALNTPVTLTADQLNAVRAEVEWISGTLAEVTPSSNYSYPGSCGDN